MIVDILSNIYKVKLINLINKILPSVFWIFCFLPINLNPENFNEFEIINQIRLVIPFLLVLIFFIYKLEIKNHFLLNENFFNFILFTTYFTLAVFFIFLNFKLNSYLNIYWGIAMLISYLHIYLYANEMRQLKVFLAISLMLLFFIFIFFIGTIFLDAIKDLQIIHLYGIYGDNNYTYLIKTPPRSSGLARMSLILNIALTIYLMKSRKSFLIKNIFTILIILFGFFLLSFQSRTITFIYFISIIIFIIIFYKKRFMPYKKNFILIIIMPTLLSIIYLNYAINHKAIKDLSYTKKHENKTTDTFDDIKHQVEILLLRNTYNKDNFSSSRIDNWKTIVKSSKENFFQWVWFSE